MRFIFLIIFKVYGIPYLISYITSCNIRPNKKNKCVMGNRSENSREDRHTYFLCHQRNFNHSVRPSVRPSGIMSGAYFFLEKKYNFMHFERHFALQNA